MTLYKEGRGPDEYEPAEDQEIMDEAVRVAHKRAEELWRGPDALNAGAVLPTSPSTNTELLVPGVARTETTEKGDTMADDGGAGSVLTRERFEMIRSKFGQAPSLVAELCEEIERRHPEWASPPPERLWRVNRTSTVILPARTEDEAKRRAEGYLGSTVVMSACLHDARMNDE